MVPEPKLELPEFYPDLPDIRQYTVAGFDLETTDLSADFGMILACVIKPLECKDPIVLRLDNYKDRDPWDDAPLVREICDVLADCSKVYGWNSQLFDVKMLRSRKVLDNIQETITFSHADLLHAAKRVFRFHNSRLDTLMQRFSKYQKTPINSEAWRRAAFGDKRAMDVVVHHCINDVLGMEDVFRYLDPHVRTWQQVTL